MPIIIDGWNFIRDRRSPLAGENGDSLRSANTLIAYLKEFRASHKDPITLVFDSAREYLDINYKNTQGLTVVPSKDADKYIKLYIDRTPERQRRNLRVVSSDNSVYFYAKSSYATPVRCADFWAKLCGGNRTDDEDGALDKGCGS